MDRYDSIIVGAGHNGLTCAAYLAKNGQRVLVLEASAVPGGLGANFEFHPGYHASIAHTASHFPQKIASDLTLASFGFKSSPDPLPTIGLSIDKDHVVLDHNMVVGVQADDLKNYQR